MSYMLAILACICLLSVPSHAADYRCEVRNKFNSEHVYSQAEITKAQFAVLVEERFDAAFLSRCSYAYSEQAVTCDRYEVDKIVFDENVRIKKFYIFRSQFDVQIFSDLSFVENNGRGDIAFGLCETVAP